MTRMLLSSLLAATFFLSSDAIAAAGKSASILSVTGEAKVGKEGAWKPAAAGAAITENEFLTLSKDATAKVKLGDGTEQEFAGKAIIPGRRLVSAKTSAGKLQNLSNAVQSATEAVMGSDPTVARGGLTRATKIATSAEDKAKLGSKTGMKWGSDIEGDDPGSTEADYAEQSLRKGDMFLARSRAQAILDNKAKSAFEKRRANYVLAHAFASDAEFTSALKKIELVIAPPEVKGGETAELVRAHRSGALVLRGQIMTQLGDASKAKESFAEALKIAQTGDPKTEPVTVAQANFFLGVIALESGSDCTGPAEKKAQCEADSLDLAKKHFGVLTKEKTQEEKQLAVTAEELLASAAPASAPK